MPKRLPSQHKGGRSPDGSPAQSSDPKINPGWAVRKSVKDAIANLPQIQSGEWSQSYLVEQVLLNYLNLPADYDLGDLEIIAKGAVLE